MEEKNLKTAAEETLEATENEAGQAAAAEEGEEKAEVKAESILELLEELGSVPEELSVRIMSEKNPEVLKRWHRLSARASTPEEFQEKM